MIESGDMGYTDEGAAGAAGGTAGAAGGAGESPAPLPGTNPGPDSGTWAGTSPEPVPTPTNIEQVTAPPREERAVESPGDVTDEENGSATRGGSGAVGTPDKAAGSIAPGAGGGPNVAGAEDAALAQGPLRQERGASPSPEVGASGLGASRGIDVAGTNASTEGASADTEEE